MRHLSEFRHAAGSWRRVVRTGCAAVADVIETVVSAIDRFWARRHETLRFPWERTSYGKFDPAAVAGRGFADIASYHERAARGAKPVLGGVSYAGADRPVCSAEASVLRAPRHSGPPTHPTG